MHMVHKGMLTHAVRHNMPHVVRDILEEVKTCSRLRRQRFLSDAAVRLLFDLCGASELENNDVSLSLGRSAMPVVVARCSQVWIFL